MTKYIIIDNENNEYNLKINEIFSLIKNNPTKDYYKKINDNIIKINNDIVINVEFICHRINTISELKNIDNIFGVEIDLRDYNNNLLLSHDPFFDNNNIDNFEDYIKDYNKNTLILNIKSERIENKLIEIMTKYNINKYLFLDSSIPMIYNINKKYNNNNFFCRISEIEPIECFIKIKDYVNACWIDCFSEFILSKEIYNIIKENNKKICLVSPELQNQFNKIIEHRNNIIKNNIIPDMICCKEYNIIYWI